MRRNRFLGVVLLLALSALPAMARQRLFGYCEQGGNRVLTSGATSKTRVQASFPGCTVTVFLAGTTTIANPIFSDNNGTVKANPFTAASTDGYWFFYADNGRYDVKLTGGSPNSIPAPGFTRGDYLANDQGTAAIASYRVTSVPFNASPQFDASQPTMYTMVLSGNVTGAAVINAVQGQTLEFNLCQDAIGGRTFIWPGNFTRPPTIGPAANACTNVIFSYNGTNWLPFAATGDTFSIAGTQIIANGVLLGLPTTPDTLVGRATVDTLTNKTLSGAVFPGASTFTEIPTPGSNPASGNLFVYAKTGDVFCAKSSAGTETCFGAGGGGNATSIQGNAVRAQSATVAGQMWAWNTTNSDFEIQAKPWIDVRDWGILCDGIAGTDNKVKAQAMFDANPGGWFIFPGNSACRFSGKIPPKGVGGILQGGGASFANSGSSAQGTTLKWDTGTSGLEMLNANGNKWVIKHLNIVGGDLFQGAQSAPWTDAILPNFTDQIGFNMFNRSIATISRTGNVATVTTTGIANESGCHTYAVGSQVKITGVTGDATFNTGAGGAYVTGVSASSGTCFDTFTYASTGSNGSGTPATGTVSIMTPGTSTADGIIAGMNYLTIEDVNLGAWGRFNINCRSDSSTWWCDNDSFHQITMTQGRGVGLYVAGGDSNASDFQQVNGQILLAGCIFDIGFLGNHHVAENCSNTGADVASTAGATKAISSITCASQICTATTSVVHGLLAGQYAVLAGLADATFQAPAGSAVGILTVPDTTHFTFAFPHADGSVGAGGTARLATGTELMTTAGIGQNSTGTSGTGFSYWISGLNNNRAVDSPYCEGTSGSLKFGEASIVKGGSLGCAVATGFNNFPFFQSSNAQRVTNWTQVDGNPLGASPDLGTQFTIRGGHQSEQSADILLADHTGTTKWTMHDLSLSPNPGWGIFRGAYPTNPRLFFYYGTQGPFNIVSMTRASNTVTVTLAAGHRISFTQFVTIAGSTGGATSFNGFFQVLSSTNTTFTFSQSGPNESATPSTGTVTQAAVNFPGYVDINAEGAGVIRLNPTSGTGGVSFFNGAGTSVGTVDSSGNAAFSGRGTFSGGLTANGAFSVNLSATAGVIDFAAATSTIPWITGTGVPNNANCTKNGMGYFRTDGTAGQEMYYCLSGTWTQQLNSGAAGASTALSNLASVAFNVALTPASGNLGTANADIGATANPVNAVWIGAAATNNSKLTGTFSAARVATIPDATGTLAMLSVAETFTALQQFSAGSGGTFFQVTGTPATAGAIRLQNTDAINFRNNANTLNLVGLTKDTADIVQVGDVAGVKVAGPITSVVAGGTIAIQPAGATGNNNGGDTTISGGAGAGTGINGNIHLQTQNLGSGGAGFIDIGNSGFGPTRPNDPGTGTCTNCIADISPAGNLIAISAGSTSGAVGITTNGAGTSGSATLIQMGVAACQFDGAATVGNYAGISGFTNGFCTDAGPNPSNVQTVGTIVSQVTLSPPVYNVLVSLGSAPASFTGGVTTSPTTTQTIQATNSTAVGLAIKQPTAGSVDIFQVFLANGTKVFSINNTGQTVIGIGASTIAANAFISANPSNPAATGLVRAVSSDSLCWRNNGNTNDVCIAKNISDVMQLNGTTGLQVTQQGAAFSSTFTFPTPAANRTITVGDPGGNDSLVYLAAIQSFTNKTFADQADFAKVATPANPGVANTCRLYYDTGTTRLKAVNDTGADCGFAGGGGASALSGITNGVAANTIASGDNAQRWNWTLTTAAKSAFIIGEAAAATNGAGAQFLLNVQTLAASTAFPLQVTARGTTNGFRVALDTGSITMLGAASMDVGLSNGTSQCPNDGVTGTTNGLIAKFTNANTCIKATTSDVGGVEAIVASGGGTTGNSLLARTGEVACTFSNATTVGDYVGVSTATAGDCLDLGSNPTAGVQVLGRVVTSGLAATSQTVLVYPWNLGIQGTTNQVNTAFANGVLTLSLPQSINTGATVQFTGLSIGATGIQGVAQSSDTQMICGRNASSAAIGCTLTLQGANFTGTATQTSGSVLIVGGNNQSTAAGVAGNVTIRPGAATAAANINGQLLVEHTYIHGVTFTTNAVQCFSADNTLSDCPTTSTEQVGVAVATNGNAAIIAVAGANHVTVLYDATVSPSAGWHACTSALTAGKVLAQSGPCLVNRQVGIIEVGGTNVTSGLINVQFR